MAQHRELFDWFVKGPAFAAKEANRCATLLLDNNIGSIAKLRKRLEANPHWLTAHGVDPGDAADELLNCVT